MKKIFISYRRSDAYDTIRLAEFLRNEFGNENIFFDIESMKPGVHWPASIKNSLLNADIMLLVIGPNWLHAQDKLSGKRRIDMETDWVRREIITFLERIEKNNSLLLIPVLVNKTEMPDQSYLDDSLARICDLTPIRIDNTKNEFHKIRTLLITNGLVPIYLPPATTPMDYPLPDQLSKRSSDNIV